MKNKSSLWLMILLFISVLLVNCGTTESRNATSQDSLSSPEQRELSPAARERKEQIERLEQSFGNRGLHDPASDFGAEPINNGTAVMINGYLGRSQIVRIPPTIRDLPVTHIREGVFRNKNLTSVTIPDSVTYIGRFAFEGNRQLTSVTIPNSVVTIGNGAFKNCTSLTNIVIPDSVKVLSRRFFRGTSEEIIDDSENFREMFEGCTSLRNVIIGNGLTILGGNVFKGCSSLTSVIIPNSVITIGNYAFNGCTALTSVTIPDSVTSIGAAAFMGCTGLTDVTIGNSVTVIGSYAFRDCTRLTNVNIGSSVTQIANEAFRDCRMLRNIIIPNSVINIGNFAFQNSGLTNVRLGNNVRTIGQDAFRDCDLRNITIPASVTRMYDTVFYGNRNLQVVRFLSQTPPTLGSGVFNYTNANVRFEVPAASVNAYKSAWMERNLSNQIFPIWE